MPFILFYEIFSIGLEIVKYGRLIMNEQDIIIHAIQRLSDNSHDSLIRIESRSMKMILSENIQIQHLDFDLIILYMKSDIIEIDSIFSIQFLIQLFQIGN